MLYLQYQTGCVVYPSTSSSYLLIPADLSNYWTPKLYFKAENGSFIDVPIVGDTDGGQMGGMAIYYRMHTRPFPFPSSAPS